MNEDDEQFLRTIEFKGGSNMVNAVAGHVDLCEFDSGVDGPAVYSLSLHAGAAHITVYLPELHLRMLLEHLNQALAKIDQVRKPRDFSAEPNAMTRGEDEVYARKFMEQSGGSVFMGD